MEMMLLSSDNGATRTMTAPTAPNRQPVLFLPHGGGPCFFMDWPDTWDHMAAFLRSVSSQLPRRPDAIVVVSGHWETDVLTVTSSAHPPLIYDYNGFPPHTYELQYPAPGDPALAKTIAALLDTQGIDSRMDESRGFDHGVFIPFMLAFADANIPVIELSMYRDLDPARHLALGRALSSLRDSNILIVATGLTFHNLRQFMGRDPGSNAAAATFDTWLTDAVEAEPTERDAALTRWADAPGARICHPREDHLIPLMVAAGAAQQDRGTRIYSDIVMGKALSGYRFG